ncbi:hypothetical protein KC363_g5869 [Hortaea werneckii]|nr:hypothetical protein KC361_g7845 [Hortaea werneckii]KAI6988162.1 hypothetical protein KC359_g7897 [Hortaea werneckii]KAI7187661.1 hypothetical protein KC363_g5869 [Hortaea werneckii]KAI7505521.1 hypothetical protein KC347_g7922 [Hortaea werneckii]
MRQDEMPDDTSDNCRCIRNVIKYSKHWGDEFHFLQAYGLNIHKEEDREEGRSIARAIILGEGVDQESDDEDAGSENSFLADLEADPMSHLADRFFNEAQLDWIKKHYRHSANLLLSYGFKPFDDEDCKQGVKVCRSLMAS